ncbi:hypothetical protein GCM10010339_73440 [Streptomyces alanosinicus]|uniref:Uncharacterized protein n=1 Tax=Streptomyces alanosinicus TaxID=68171 RepID=A0A918YR40_9ACTN|nr:hypothetical protein GCM10010339_73440 [Streptomyces alanosinicus]
MCGPIACVHAGQRPETGSTGSRPRRMELLQCGQWLRADAGAGTERAKTSGRAAAPVRAPTAAVRATLRADNRDSYAHSPASLCRAGRLRPYDPPRRLPSARLHEAPLLRPVSTEPGRCPDGT